MRKLTLDEKISLKGMIANKGIKGMAGMDMKAILHYWYICYGRSIAEWYKLSFKRNSQMY